MDSPSTSTGLAIVSVGVLIVVLSRLLDTGDAWRLTLSLVGAAVTVVGVVVVVRARRSEQ